MNKEQLKIILSDQALARQTRVSRHIDRLQQLPDWYLTSQEVCTILGVRRSGKSSLLQLLELKYKEDYNIFFLELEDPRLEGFKDNDFQLAYETWSEVTEKKNKKTLMLWDEVQKDSKWERWADHFSKNLNNKVIITGSNSKLLSSELATYLTGRHLSFELWPLSFAEIVNYKLGKEGLSAIPSTEQTILLNKIWNRYFELGGFPRIFYGYEREKIEDTGARGNLILAQYLKDILEKDIVTRYGARLTQPLRELAGILCTDNGKILNRSKLAKHLGIKDNATIKKYCSYFENSYLFFELKNFSYSLRSQQRSLAKYYCVDPAFARASSFNFSKNEGTFLENLVAIELRRRGYQLFYWKSKTNQSEVDFIARKAGESDIAIQVSLDLSNKETLNRELKGLAMAHKELNIKRSCIVSLNNSSTFLSEDREIQNFSFLYWSLRSVDRTFADL